jgi:hypothetical protein
MIISNSLERVSWVPCHHVGENGTGLLSVDDLFLAGSLIEDAERSDEVFALLNSALMANSIIKQMVMNGK